MILDLTKLKKSVNNEESFFFEYYPEEKLLDLPNAEIVLPVKVLGTVEAFKGSAYVDMEITFTIEGECSRCLEEAKQTVTVNFEEEFEENGDGEFTYANDRIDLTKTVNDEIIMNQPLVLLCKEDCLGLCPTCGKNRNHGECECEK